MKLQEVCLSCVIYVTLPEVIYQHPIYSSSAKVRSWAIFKAKAGKKMPFFKKKLKIINREKLCDWGGL